jgi:very-short-patch-repair endonuclease
MDVKSAIASIIAAHKAIPLKNAPEDVVEYKQKLSKARKGKIPWNKGKKNVYSEETRRKISEAQKGNMNNKGKHHSIETKKRMSDAQKGHTVSKETKKKIGLGNKGKIHSEELKRKMSIIRKGKPAWNKGLSMSDEFKQKVSKGLKDRKLSEEHKRNIGIAGKGKYHTKETKRKISITKKEAFKKGEIKLPKKYCNTSIEIAMKKQFEKNDIEYEHQKYFNNIGLVDFFLPNFNLIIECDGDYWHNRDGAQQKDVDRDLRALFNGYNIVRLWEHEINDSPEKCMERILAIGNKG